MEGEQQQQFEQQQQQPTPPPRDVGPTAAADTTGGGGQGGGGAYDPWEDKKYFDEYAKLDIHCDMLHDASRMDSYYNAITRNAAHFQDKVVLDVGCGTGVLACWSALAGARKVYAVEACSVADQAEMIVLRNGLTSKVEILRGRIETLVLPEKVDIIISEWMGSFLLFESMLESVLWARDHWLKEGGKLYPELGRLYVLPICFDKFFEKKVGGLHDVRGVNMSLLGPLARKELTTWGIRGRKVKQECVIGTSQLVIEVDVRVVQAQDLMKILTPLECTVTETANLSGFAAWFEVIFPSSTDSPVVLSTHPSQPLTHWRQDVFLLETSVAVTKGTPITGCLKMTQNAYWKRHFDFEFSFHVGEHELHKVFST